MRGIIDILILCLKMLIMWRTANADWRIGYSTWVFHVELKSNAAMWQVGLDELFKWLGAFALEWQNQRNEFWQKGIGHQLSGDGLTVAGWICVTFVAQRHTHTLGQQSLRGLFDRSEKYRNKNHRQLKRNKPFNVAETVTQPKNIAVYRMNTANGRRSSGWVAAVVFSFKTYLGLIRNTQLEFLRSIGWRQ